MKPDSMLVEPEYVGSARADVAAKGSSDSLAEFAQTEPALASFIYEGLAMVAGKLSLAGAPQKSSRVRTKTSWLLYLRVSTPCVAGTMHYGRIR